MNNLEDTVIDNIIWREPVETDARALVELEQAVLADDDFDFETLSIPKDLPPTQGRAAHAGFLPDGRMAAFGVLSVSGAQAQTATLRLAVRPSFQKMGLEDYLIGWAQAEAWDKKSLVIADEHVTPETDFLYTKLGYSRTLVEDVMRLDLRLPLPTGPYPRNVSITNWAPGTKTQFFDTYNASFSDRPGFPNWTYDQWTDWLADDDFRPDLSLLAMVQDDPAAFIVSHYEKKGIGWITQVGVKHCYRRTGLASMLIGEVLKQFAREGAEWAMLDVNENNPEGQKLYRKLGFEVVRLRGKYEKTLLPTR